MPECTSNPMPRPRGSCRGFSLVEVLVAILILAVGLLGLAALQARGVKFNHDAYARSQATFLAHQMIEAMQARNDPDLATSLDGYLEDAADACDPAASSAANDLRCWLDTVGSSLPAGTGRIEQNGAVFNVILLWQERSGRDADADTCEDIASREWGADGICRVVQPWTFRPARSI